MSEQKERKREKRKRRAREKEKKEKKPLFLLLLLTVFGLPSFSPAIDRVGVAVVINESIGKRFELFF